LSNGWANWMPPLPTPCSTRSVNYLRLERICRARGAKWAKDFLATDLRT
jgi:hypothetical protein